MGKKNKVKTGGKPKLSLDPTKKKVLHVIGSETSTLNAYFNAEEWQEVRVDSRPQYKPDMVANVASMPQIANGSYQGAYFPHTLNRFYAHQVPIILKEMYRVLEVEGSLLISAPDIQKIAENISLGVLEQPLYGSAVGGVAAIDLLYGFRPAIEKGDIHGAQKTAFTIRTLAEKIKEAGFLSIQMKREGFIIWAMAYKSPEGMPLRIEITEPDINKVMRVRDELVRDPELPVIYPPLRNDSDDVAKKS